MSQISRAVQRPTMVEFYRCDGCGFEEQTQDTLEGMPTHWYLVQRSGYPFAPRFHACSATCLVVLAPKLSTLEEEAARVMRDYAAIPQK